MAKTSNAEVPTDEQKIVRILEQHARDSMDAIAKQCGFSRQKVWRIIKQLDEKGTIWGYHAVVNPAAFSMNTYLILMKRNTRPVSIDIVDIVKRRENAKNMKDLGVELQSSWFVHGKYDLAILCRARDIANVKRFQEYMYKAFPNYLEGLTILEVVFPIEENGFLNPQMDKMNDLF